KKKYARQRQILQAERDRDAALANATKAIEELRTSLSAELESLDALAASARASFKGYGNWLRLLSRPPEAQPGEATADEHQLLVDLREGSGRAQGDLERLGKFAVLRLFRQPLTWL